MKFCIFMPTTFYTDPNSYLAKIGQLYDVNQRINNYIDGLNAFNIYLKEMLKYDWKPDIYLMDNSAPLDKLPKELQQAIKNIPNIKYIDNTQFHTYGKINKGSGLIEQYKEVKNIFKKYDKIIHFEPRQILLDSSFFQKAIKNPNTNYFRLVKKVYLYTGLFSIDSKIWMEYINIANPKKMADKFISIEHHLLDFFKEKGYQYEDTALGLLWVQGEKKNQF